MKNVQAKQALQKEKVYVYPDTVIISISKQKTISQTPRLCCLGQQLLCSLFL